jgi:HEAT repeat protein
VSSGRSAGIDQDPPALSGPQVARHLGALGTLLALLGVVYLSHTGARAVPGLIEDLQGTDVQAQALAALHLGQIGPEASPAVPTLLALAVTSPGAYVTTTAAGALPSIALPASRQVMHVWLPRLRDADAQVRRDAASALGALGPVARPAVGALVAALDDPDTLVRDRATRALGSVGVPADAVMQGLLRALHDPEWTVRHAAVAQFAFAGFPTDEALPALRDLEHDENRTVAQLARSAVASAEREVGTDSYLLMLGQGMNAGYSLLQIAKRGSRSSQAVPAITAILTADRPLERYLAVCALEAIGKPALAPLRQALGDADPVVREAAADAVRLLEAAEKPQ